MRIGKWKLLGLVGLGVLTAAVAVLALLGQIAVLVSVATIVLSMGLLGVGWQVAVSGRQLARDVARLERHLKRVEKRVEAQLDRPGGSGKGAGGTELPSPVPKPYAEQLLRTVRGGMARLEKGQEQYAKQLSKRVAVEFRQIEELLALYHELQPVAGLPHLRSWAGSPDFQRFLYRIGREEQPKTVLECGSGTSTLVMARALQRNGGGRVVALEHLEEFADHTREALVRSGLEAHAEVIHAPLVDTAVGEETFLWYDLGAVGSIVDIDVLVVDGPPRSTQPLARYPAVPQLWHALAPGVLVLLDDAKRDDESAVVERWLEEYADLRLEVLDHERGTAVLRRSGT